VSKLHRKIITGMAAYVAIAFIAFGWSYNHTELCFHGPHPDTQQVGDWCYTEQWRIDRAGMVGAFWPVVAVVALGYITIGTSWHAVTQFAISVTRWP
jgi:hypothetical protein